MSAAPTTLTLPPELTEQLRELHTAQSIINSLEPVGDTLTALEEMVEAQQDRCSEIIDQLMDLMDCITPHHHRNGDPS